MDLPCSIIVRVTEIVNLYGLFMCVTHLGQSPSCFLVQAKVDFIAAEVLPSDDCMKEKVGAGIECCYFISSFHS